MKKIFLIIAFCGVFLLAGCNQQSDSTVENNRVEQQKQNRLIKKNRQIWNKRVRSAKDIRLPSYERYITKVPTGYNDDDMSLSRLENGNQLVVKAKVMNLQPEFGLFTVETKASILITEVISGDKSLQGKVVKTEFSGGLAKAKDYFTDIEGNYSGKEFGVNDPKTIIYSANPVIPMPKIGNTVILGISRYRPENKYQQKMAQKNGLMTKNSYMINNPEVTYWVMRQGKFKLNNPAFYQKENKGKYPNLFKLTNTLNEKYAK